MIGTVLQKPVAPADFRQAVEWCCNPENHARLMEYHDRYEVAVESEGEQQPELGVNEQPSIEERLDDIEAALIELAGIIGGE